MNDYEFRSVFAAEMHSLIELKRSLGFKYENEEGALRRLDKYFVSRNLTEKVIDEETVELWCQKRSWETENNRNSRVSQLRVLTAYLAARGFDVVVPEKGLFSHGPKYVPHIYTDEELKAFFRAVDQCQSVPGECPYRAEVLPLFFRILYTSGLRVTELRLVRIRDISFEECFITIENAKNNKKRRVPVHPFLMEKCLQMKRSIHSQSSEDAYFFIIRDGEPMTIGNVYKNFRRFLEKAGISHTGKGPRVHDFRHTYAVNLLRKWVDEGKDVMAYLPYMRTVLGHETFEETAYYLTLTAERYPYIRDQMKKSFPDLIREAIPNDENFY